MNSVSNPSGTAPAAPRLADHEALPPGTRFGEFEILRVIGVGGFGIVYLAHDHSLEREVALKEYMPAALATRGEGAKITVRAGGFAETYAMGLRSFVNEARLLARFDHPSLLKVYRFWEDNATAYTVMPYLQGPTLRAARLGGCLMTGPPTEAWLRGVLGGMLEALEVLHAEGVFHRDIAPDNIVLLPAGIPVLLDFGAARRVIGDHAQSLTAILKPSYAPIEQYAETFAMRQGPWTDLYALGAVMHFLLFGEPPAPATVRAVQDDAVPIEARALPPGVSRRFALVIGWMLGVRPAQRPQSVAALRAVLDGEAAVPPFERTPARPPAPAASARRGASDASHCTTVPRVAAAVAGADEIDNATVTAPARPAPMRSTPPGSLPPVYVPARRGEGAAVDRDAAGPDMVTAFAPRRRMALAGIVAAAAVGLAALALVSKPMDAAAPQREAAPPVDARSGAAREARVHHEPSLAAVASARPAVSPSGLREPLPALPALPASLPASLRMAGVGAAAVPAMLTAGTRGEADAPRVRAVPRPAWHRVRGAPNPAAQPSALRSAPGYRAQRSASGQRAPLVASAREACAGRHFISAAVCMERECERQQFRRGAECVRVLYVKRERAERRAAL